MRWNIEHKNIELNKARSSIDSMLGWLKYANTYNLRQKLGLEELRRFIMKSLPKTLNSKQDYLYLKENTSKEYYVPFFQELLDSRFGWYFVENLPTGKEGINDDTHKVVVNENMGNEETVYAQYELKENENAKIYTIGFTVEEVEEIIE